MEMPEIIALAFIVLIIGGAIFYIAKAKKNGQKCIGCPSGSKCQGKCNSCNCCSVGQDKAKEHSAENNTSMDNANEE